MQATTKGCVLKIHKIFSCLNRKSYIRTHALLNLLKWYLNILIEKYFLLTCLFTFQSTFSNFWAYYWLQTVTSNEDDVSCSRTQHGRI